MSRYKYLGPFDMIQLGSQTIHMYDVFETDQDAFVASVKQQGFHMFQDADENTQPGHPNKPAPAPEESSTNDTAEPAEQSTENEESLP